MEPGNFNRPLHELLLHMTESEKAHFTNWQAGLSPGHPEYSEIMMVRLVRVFVEEAQDLLAKLGFIVAKVTRPEQVLEFYHQPYLQNRKRMDKDSALPDLRQSQQPLLRFYVPYGFPNWCKPGNGNTK